MTSTHVDHPSNRSRRRTVGPDDSHLHSSIGAREDEKNGFEKRMAMSSRKPVSPVSTSTSNASSSLVEILNILGFTDPAVAEAYLEDVHLANEALGHRRLGFHGTLAEHRMKPVYLRI